jgi:hypothetical protein
VDRKLKLLIWGACGCALAAISLGIVAWSLGYQARSGTENPNSAEWLQGWGSIFGLVVTVIGALVAGGVYYETVKAAQITEARRLEDRVEAEAAANAAEQRYHEETVRALMDASVERLRAQKELENAQRATSIAQQQAADERAHREHELREAELAGPRAVLVTRVTPSMASFGVMQKVGVYVFNYGPQPIRRVRCLARVMTTGAEARINGSIIAPDRAESFVWSAGDGLGLLINMEIAPTWALEDESDIWLVKLRFLDAAGQAWERLNNGEPVKVSTTDIPPTTLPPLNP